MTEAEFDADTRKHIARVQQLVGLFCAELQRRAANHDASKLSDPTERGLIPFVDELRKYKYGSPEYMAVLRQCEASTRRHYTANAHHPEHHEDGVAGMSLFDLVEMLCDWVAATERRPGGDIMASIATNQQRFEVEDQLASALYLTAHEFGELQKEPKP